MLGLLFSLLTFSHLSLAKGSINSDCKADELSALKSPETIKQFAVEANLVELDCTVIRNEKKNEKLLVLVTLNSLDGLQTFVGLFARPTLKPGSLPRFKSDALGVDSFAFFVSSKQRRLIFVLPETDSPGMISFYTCTQNSNGDLRFVKRVLNEKLLSLSTVDDHTWPVEASKAPQLFLEKGKWRAIVMRKLVDL